MEFWKEHVALRITLILLLCIAGVALVIWGWRQTGQLWGLGVMLAGVALLLGALGVYNQRFVTPKRKK